MIERPRESVRPLDVVHYVAYARYHARAVIEVNDGFWGVWGEYPLRSQRRRLAQRKTDKAPPLIRFACEALFQEAPRTHAMITCMTYLVVMAKRSR